MLCQSYKNQKKFCQNFLTEKFQDFSCNLKNLGKIRKEKADPRLVGGEDRMIVRVGKPGSAERVAALESQYAAILACGEEVSPFSEG